MRVDSRLCHRVSHRFQAVQAVTPRGGARSARKISCTMLSDAQVSLVREQSSIVGVAHSDWSCFQALSRTLLVRRRDARRRARGVSPLRCWFGGEQVAGSADLGS
jgi:hypothetical protein